MGIEQLWIKGFLVSDLFQSFLPEIPAHSFHHMQSGQNHQIRLELLQTGHERLQRAHFTVGHVMGQDKAVSLRSSWGTPLFTCRGRQRKKCSDTKTQRYQCDMTEVHLIIFCFKYVMLQKWNDMWMWFWVGLTWLVLQDEVELIHLLQRFWWDHDLFIQHIMKLRPHRTT